MSASDWNKFVKKSDKKTLERFGKHVEDLVYLARVD